MSAGDRIRAYKDAVYSRNPLEKRDQAAFRRFAENKINQLNEIVFWAKDYHDTGHRTTSRIFMHHYNNYHDQVDQYLTELGRIITRHRSSHLIAHFFPIYQQLENMVERMVEMAETPSESSSESSSEICTEIPVFPKRKITPGVIPIGERLGSFKMTRPTMVHKKIPLVRVPTLRRTYEDNFHILNQDFRSIQADPDISPRRLSAFNAEKLYYEYLRTTYSKTIENGLKYGVEGTEPLNKLIKRFTEHLQQTVTEIRRLSTGPESEESDELSSDSDQ